jgi:outer membrane protein TolC
LDQERRAAAATVESTRRSARPDLAVGIEGREYAGDAGFRNGTVTLSLSLPWWNRSGYRHDLERDRNRLRAVEQDSAEANLTLRNEIHHALIEISNARREALSIQTELLPRTDQAQSAALNAWISNQGPLSDVLDTRRLYLETRLARAKAIAEQWTRIHELSRLCGITAREALRIASSGAAPTTDSANHAH